VDCAGRSWGADLPDLTNIHGLRPLGTSADLELDGVTVLQSPETVSLNRTEVNEQVRSIVTPDEPVALGIVEPFDKSARREISTSMAASIWLNSSLLVLDRITKIGREKRAFLQ